ncbi:acyl transferase/acyl hydrolase/lysophospholipase [Polychytrium aggregatum]|uniref:acyl transferase/acyl hydrolase/lysophospholipase n=1 Tax=Polychytrium aggregatum TaxID=110093 RepID=UPI0022FEDE6A|nr:acyl transferase/acyl hydrolase/lysophospholipase [Polychytrium aggregatum]KAI9207153.1 acyl transferase/acyl hydrolase/lysophospholipase [Polychytrium aggregatum]
MALLDILRHLWTQIQQMLWLTWVFWLRDLWDRREDQVLREALHNATDYATWLSTAQQLDIITGAEGWKAKVKSKDYDYNLIQDRLRHLREVRQRNDIRNMIYLLRSGLLRNIGGLVDVKLFRRSFIGTKKLIEDYLNEVVAHIEYISDSDIDELSIQEKIDFFTDTRQSFGRTALLLHGGATFGLYHLGVVKTLFEHGSLPRIVSGSSVGALIAALVCIRTDEELPSIFRPDGINLKAFARKGSRGNVRRKVTRFLKHGYLMDVKVLEDCVRSNVGDITFEEAFQRTKRMLNITVASSRNNEVPKLLNYLTAPNVLIWSAACASAASVGLYDVVVLLAKDKHGNIVNWSPQAIKWDPIQSEIETPETRLSELFNANHFILSQASPYIAPFLARGPQTPRERVSTLTGKISIFIASEIRHRLSQLSHLGLLPPVIRGMFDQKFEGHVTISPQASSMDFYTLFSNPTYASMQYWITKGEQATWPFLCMIKCRTMIELALDRALIKVRAEAKRQSGPSKTILKHTVAPSRSWTKRKSIY